MLTSKAISYTIDSSDTSAIDFEEIPLNKNQKNYFDTEEIPRFGEAFIYPIISYLLALSLAKKPHAGYDLLQSISNLGNLVNKIQSEFKSEELLNEIPILQEKFILRNENVVLEFLFENSFMIPLLFEAKNEIENFFPSSELILEVNEDPEEVDSRDLFIIIKTDLSIDKAFDKLEALEKNWLFNKQIETNYKLFIDVEFK